MSMEGSANSDTLQVKTSRSGHPVPSVNEVLLHSIYNPIKESESVLEKHRAQLQHKSCFLILGLGFGYHIDAIFEYAIKFFRREELKICVLEPSADLVKLYYEVSPDSTCEQQSSNPIWRENKYRIFTADNVKSLYSNKDFLDFLTLRPTLIPHPASFNLHQKFYRDFLTFESQNKIEEIANELNNSKLKTYLQSQNPDQNFNDFIAQLKEKHENITKEDFLLLALERCSRAPEVSI